MNQPPFNVESNAGRNNAFLAQVEWRGLGRRPWGPSIRSKRKFARGGKFEERADKQGITVSYEKMSWNLTPIDTDGGGGHFGMLCIIAHIKGRWFAWNIEYLRKATEETSTSSVNTNGWPSRDWVELVMSDKRFAPDEADGFRFADGDWFGFMIVPHPDAEPKVQNVRTDILPVRYEGEDTPPPPGEYEKGWNEALAAAVRAAEALRK
jgi:hypothetical protein